MDITNDLIKEFAESLTLEQYNTFLEEVDNRELNNIKEKIRSQVPDSITVYSMMSQYQYFEQTIEIDPSLVCTFRTQPDEAGEAIVSFALSRLNKSVDNGEVFEKLKKRRKLSYGVRSLNDISLVGHEEINASYWELAMSGIDIDAKIKELADISYNKMKLLPGVLIDKIRLAYDVWEVILYERMNGSNLESNLKN